MDGKVFFIANSAGRLTQFNNGALSPFNGNVYDNQKWRIEVDPNRPGYFWIINYATGKSIIKHGAGLLDVSAPSKEKAVTGLWRISRIDNKYRITSYLYKSHYLVMAAGKNLATSDARDDKNGRWSTEEAPKDAKYGAWVSDGCSTTCGPGLNRFNRKCTGYGSCDGQSSKVEPCNLKECPLVFRGGWGAKKCVFPFTYNGKKYYQCTEDNNNKSPWCSHDAVYKGNWGYCHEDPSKKPYPGMGHESCVFPFVYEGVTYNQCTRTNGHAKPWCAHNANYVTGKWSYCKDAAKYGEWISEGCSVTCGNGLEKFHRKCEGYGTCTGRASKGLSCKRPKCPDTKKPDGEADATTIKVISKGFDLGPDAQFFVNGKEQGNTGRGYNIMVMNPVTKAVTTKRFDTWENAATQIPAMNKYIADIPLGSIVAVAVRDAQYKNGGDLTKAIAGSRSGLDSLGGGRAGCPYGVFRDAWALITLKVANLDDLPPWFTCQHRPTNTIPATVTAVIPYAKPEADVVTVKTISKGFDIGSDAKFIVNGKEQGNTGRGYNIMVMNPVTKAVTTKRFDTWENAATQIPAMNKYIANIPLGSIVAVAVRDAQYVNGGDLTKAIAGSRSGLDTLGGGRAGCPYGK